MEKTFKGIVINRVDLGQRVTGYEVYCPNSNGGEILGYTPKMMMDAVKSGEVMGMTVNKAGELVPDTSKGFKTLMIKTGIGTLTSSDPNSIANVVFTVVGRDGDMFKVINSRFGRLTYCADKVKALLDLGAVNGVILDGDKLVCGWELEPPKSGDEAPAQAGKTGEKKK